MDFTTLLGIILITTAVVLLVGLVLWSRRVINRIAASKGPKSARMILREFREDNGG